MAMDKRQTQIQEAAGLEESKYNQEFIEFLRRFGGMILVAVALISMAYYMYQRYQARVAAQTDVAWVELDDAIRAGSPEGLLRVADEHAGERGVPLHARLAAADAWYTAALEGVTPGGLDAQGKPSTPDSLLTPEKRAEQLAKALEQYSSVAGSATTDPDLAQIALIALWGKAAVQETLGKLDDAKATFQQIVELSNRADFVGQAAAAQDRLATIDSAKSAPRLYAEADVKTAPKKPEPVAPAAAPATTGDLGLPVGVGADAPAIPAPAIDPNGPAVAPSFAPTSPPPTAPPASGPPATSPSPTPGANPAPAPAPTPPPAEPNKPQ